MTFKYCAELEIRALPLWKIIIDSSAFFFLSMSCFICNGRKVVHFRGHIQVPEPYSLNMEKIKSNHSRILDFKFQFQDRSRLYSLQYYL